MKAYWKFVNNPRLFNQTLMQIKHQNIISWN